MDWLQNICLSTASLPSVLWRCWLGGRKGIRPVKKTEWWGAGVVICLERGADLHMAQLMPLPLAFSKIQIGFTFLVPAYPSSPGKSVVKRVCVYCKLTTDRSHLRSANACLLSVPRTQTTYGDRSFAVSGPVAWNSSPVALRSSDITEETFRKQLKTFFV